MTKMKITTEPVLLYVPGSDVKPMKGIVQGYFTLSDYQNDQDLEDGESVYVFQLVRKTVAKGPTWSLEDE